jgi:hypothetical protein
MVDQFMNQLRVLNADADSNFSKLVENKTIEDFIREDFKILR